MRSGAVAALASLLVAAAADPTAEAEGGYWRAGEREGHYRARVVGDASGAAVQVDWIAHASDTEPEHAVASETLTGLAPAGTRVSTPELRAEGEATLLTLDARDPLTGSGRQLAIELGGPGHLHRRAR
jgi:hypothetical protein